MKTNLAPAEKAQELMDKHFSIYPDFIQDEQAEELAKESALIEVDDILFIFSRYNDTQVEVNYWQDVKNELLKFNQNNTEKDSSIKVLSNSEESPAPIESPTPIVLNKSEESPTPIVLMASPQNLFAPNSITLGRNATNTHENCIVISCSPKDDPNTLEFRDNGDIYVHGKLTENDKEIVEGFREFLTETFNRKS